MLTVAGGKAHSSRVAASVILALGLPELVARSLEDYQDIAVRLAQHPRIYGRQFTCFTSTKVQILTLNGYS